MDITAGLMCVLCFRANSHLVTETLSFIYEEFRDEEDIRVKVARIVPTVEYHASVLSDAHASNFVILQVSYKGLVVCGESTYNVTVNRNIVTVPELIPALCFDVGPHYFIKFCVAVLWAKIGYDHFSPCSFHPYVCLILPSFISCNIPPPVS
jgi:hypothetical protein